ncbi:MAG: TatD family hydrolase [Acidimicrobiia bacterium]
MPWVDTHCHLDDERLPGGSVGALERARAAGVTRCITIGTDATHTAAALAIAAANDDVWATVGLHPHDAINGVETILGFLDAPNVVAIGECGLDYHYNHSPREAQMQAFADQVALANERGLALVIHTRDAWDDTFDVLRAQGTPERTIFHCFSGGPDEATACLDLGAYLSFSGIVTFKTADDIRAAARLCPLDRMLVETDSPYLAPVPHRGKTNEPALVTVVGAGLAVATGRSLEAVEAGTWASAAVAFGL